MEDKTIVKRSMYINAAALLAILAAALLAAPMVDAQGGRSGLSITAEAAFDGYFKYGEWLPIWVQVENNGADLDGELRVRIADSWGATNYAAQAQLPSGSRKRIPLYVLPNNFSHTLEVQLVSGGQVLASQNVDVSPEPNINYFIGYIAPQPGALSLLKTVSLPGQRRFTVPVAVSLAELPERVEGLRSLDALVINATDTSTLTSAQQAALETWVRQGGRLVVGGGAEALQTAAGLPETLLPFEPRQVIEVDALAGLTQYAGQEAVRVPGPFVIAAGEAKQPARALASQEGTALVQEWQLGNGTADFVALDLASSPFDAWNGTAGFWEALLAPGATYPEGMPVDMSPRQMRSDQMNYALSNLPSLDLPSIRGIGILLAAYVLLVGPVNYLILRWRRRLHLAWITIPVFTIAFSLGAFSLGYAMRGTDLILNKVAVVELRPDGSGNVNSYLGLFSPARQSYEIEVSGSGLVSPLRPSYDPWGGQGGPSAGAEAVFLQGDPGVVRGLTVNQWSMQAFMTETTWDGIGSIQGDLVLDGQQLSGTVQNQTDFNLTDVVVILGNQFTRLGDMAAGESKTVTMDVPTLVGQPFESPVIYRLFSEFFDRPSPTGPPREAQLKQAVLESVFPWGTNPGTWSSSVSRPRTAESLEAVFLGWFDHAPPEVSIGRRKPAQQTTALLYATLPMRLAEGNTVSLPPGIIPGTVIEMPQEGGYCGPMGSPAVYFNQGQAVFEYHMPEVAQGVEVSDLVVHIGTDMGLSRAPATAIYNWDSGSWEDLADATPGRNLVPASQGLINPNGDIRLRLSSDNFIGGGCFYVALGLEGSR